jgi:hypothetical protein
MRRWAEFVLAHRRWVALFWLVVVVGGGVASGQVSKRMTYDWSLPGEPGTKTAQQITQTFGNGGYTAPYLVSVTYPAGQAVAGRQAEVAAAFDAVATKVPSVRVLDEANTGDAAFRTKDGRTSYAMVFYRFNPSPTAQIPTEQIRAALEAAKPVGSTVGVTGEDALAVGSDSEGPGVLAETLLGGVGALAVLAFVFASFLALLPLVVAAASIMATFALLLPLTYLGDFSAIVQFLIALIGLGVAIDYSLLLVTRWREERFTAATTTMPWWRRCRPPGTPTSSAGASSAAASEAPGSATSTPTVDEGTAFGDGPGADADPQISPPGPVGPAAPAQLGAARVQRLLPVRGVQTHLRLPRRVRLAPGRRLVAQTAPTAGMGPAAPPSPPRLAAHRAGRDHAV